MNKLVKMNKPMKWAVAIPVIIVAFFGLAAALVGGVELIGNCFWPPEGMADAWGWRLISVPLGAIILVVGGGISAGIIAGVAIWVSEVEE